jgi:hypothetical protein
VVREKHLGDVISLNIIYISSKKSFGDLAQIPRLPFLREITKTKPLWLLIGGVLLTSKNLIILNNIDRFILILFVLRFLMQI